MYSMTLKDVTSCIIIWKKYLNKPVYDQAAYKPKTVNINFKKNVYLWGTAAWIAIDTEENI